MNRKVSQFDHVPNTEKGLELKLMQERIQQSLSNPETLSKVRANFLHTFEQIGLSTERAQELRDTIMEMLSSQKTVLETEHEALRLFKSTKISNGSESNLIEAIHEKLQDRADLIFQQLAPHLENTAGPVIDYGAGDGQVTQKLNDKLGLAIEGVDVRSYTDPKVTVPISTFDGGTVDAPDKAFEAGVITNVLHHEQNNEKIIRELDRIVEKKIIVIETVPMGGSEEEMDQDKDRTFMNDYFYNRLFHNADVPVPGTYETPQGWVDRFKKYGWTVTHEKDLGVDQDVIEDRHYLFVFER